MKNHDFFQKSACAMLICQNDSNATIVEANDAFYYLIGYSHEEVTTIFHNSLTSLIVDDVPSILQKLDKVAQDHTAIDFEFHIHGRDGQLLTIHAISKYDGESNGFYVVLMDISYKAKALENLAHIATLDRLTGLLNRQTIELQIKDVLNTATDGLHFALFIIDIDNFKQVNAQLGHQYGDTILAQASFLLANTFRKSDLLGRLGGDEFIIFLQYNGNLDFIENFAHRLITNQSVIDSNYPITFSVGISIADGASKSFESLYKEAEKALYHAKHTGASTYRIYDTTMV
ncbi:MAG: sensor domain-containing diguanylate cyclase [Eubacteriales bacterium]